jgi:hypothetical protein
LVGCGHQGKSLGREKLLVPRRQAVEEKLQLALRRFEIRRQVIDFLLATS